VRYVDKLFNVNGYTVGKYSSWHCFMDSLARFAIVPGVITLAVIVVYLGKLWLRA